MNDRACSSTFAVVLLLSVCSVSLHGQTQEDLETSAYYSRTYVQLSRSGKINEAVATAERYAEFLLQRFPKRDHWKASLYLGEAYGFQARYKEAMEQWHLTIERIKDAAPQTELERQAIVVMSGDALKSIGFCLENLGRAAEAVPYFEAGVDYWSKARHPNARRYYANAQTALADAHIILGNSEKARSLLNAATATLEPLARADTNVGHSSPSYDLSLTLHMSGELDAKEDRYDLAEVKLRRALQLRATANGWHHLDTAKVLDSLVRLYGSQGRWQEAEMYCRAELEAYEQSVGQDHVEITTAQIRMAAVLNAQDRHAEAEPILRRAAAQLTAAFGADNTRTTTATFELAKTLWNLEKYDEAETVMLKNLEIGKKLHGPASALLSDDLNLLASLKFSQGKPAESLQVLDELLKIHQVSPLTPQDLESLYINRSSALWYTGKREEAVLELDKCLDQVELLRSFSSGAERERAEMFQEVSASFVTAIAWQAELKNAEKLFAAVERVKARSFLDELKLKNADLLAGLSAEERAELTRTENQLRQELLAAENRYYALPELGPQPAAEAIEQRKKLASEVMSARDRLYRHLADIRSASPIYRELIVNKTAAPTVAQVQQLLGDDEILLSYSVGAYHSYVIAVRRDSVQFTELTLDEATATKLGVEAGSLTAAMVSQVLQDKKTGLLTIVSSPHRRDEKVGGVLSSLWKALIPATERDLLTSGKLKLLTILPDGPLALLPFETLVTSDDEEHPEYLLDVGPPIAYAPSAAVLLNLASRTPSDAAAAQKLLTLGDPSYAAPTATTDAVDRKVGVQRSIDRFRASLSRLPFTGKESNWVQQNLEKIGFTTVKVTGPAATEAAIRQHAPGRQIIHLACHGMADQNYGNFFGALAIAPGRAGDPRDDGYLSMSEIYELNLDGCELAILSACETNYGPQQQGEGVWALSRGFLVAGSRRVVASNWVVDDAAGATLVSYFAGYLTLAGKDPTARNYASALHNAKKQVRKQEQWKHPFYWSSLVLVGPK
ncbi:CHAT domain protein [Anatilimnocola aggregata]|uniref:CHAT domain protein n=1 Tax=Anatilimnocola aggregata TaxID=2528021 RepID=A0A517Y4Q2_9BACT|nr:CHAT domain-containing protein [Anatilimnocola aggregata]QDU25102.1 CHAT domain protein [Anatilimnocola aggregata]